MQDHNAKTLQLVKGMVLGAVLTFIAYFMSGCTLSSGIVKDLKLDNTGKVQGYQSCTIKYVALYSLFVSETCNLVEVK